MADDLGMNVDRLPTLTEVLELGRDTPAASLMPDAAFAPHAIFVPHATAHAGPEAATHWAADPAADTDLVAQVLALLEPRIGALLETRLREALAPALARAADGLMRDARLEVATTLRSVVEEAVAQAQRLHRTPQ